MSKNSKQPEREIERLNGISKEQVRKIAEHFGTPVYAYSQKILEEQADKVLHFPAPFGFTARFALKANPNATIAKIFHEKGLHFDVSSGLEAFRLMRLGIPMDNCLLTSQEIPSNLDSLVRRGMKYNACSLHQLDNYGQNFPGTNVSIRVNSGLGSGGTNRTNTGGPASSFGIWHEQLTDALKIAKKYGLNIERMHSHIGSGSDPEVWKKVARMCLYNVERIINVGQDINILNLGGGYKVGRMNYEKSTDLQECGRPVTDALVKFADRTGKKLNLEIEPGTYLVANAGFVISRVIDLKETPRYKFIVTNTGMTEVTRPSLYGAQHPIIVVPRHERRRTSIEDYVVSGHCCESGDILTPAPGDSEALQPRALNSAKIGDYVVVGGAGAYCAGMATTNYNSFLQAPEVLIDRKGKLHLIRRRQEFSQMVKNEIMPDC